MNKRKESKYKTIGQITKELGLIDSKSGNLQTHTLRFWESQFKQIRPKIRLGNRRYYSEKDFKVIKLIKYLLKDQGMTIKGVKKILDNLSSNKLDENIDLSIHAKDYNLKEIKSRLTKITGIISDLKKIKNG